MENQLLILLDCLRAARTFNTISPVSNNNPSSSIPTEPEYNFTGLHSAAMKNDEEHANNLIKFHADINSAVEDGVQPIHLACLRKNYQVVEILLKAGANPDAELTKELVEKYSSGIKWSDEFGNKMTLLTLAVVNNNEKLSSILLDYKANIRIRSIKNQTLLMYAIKEDCDGVAKLLISKMKNHMELIDARDNSGKHAVHYFLNNEKFGDYRFVFIRTIRSFQDAVLKELICAGANINATVNEDPDTLLLNMAAYRCSESILKPLLCIAVPLSAKSKPLYYATLPVNRDKFMLDHKNMLEPLLEETREKICRYILEIMVLRIALGLFVPEEEKKLMDHLVATDDKIEMIVSNFKVNVIDGILKKEVFQNGDECVKFYDTAVKVFNDKKLKCLVKDDCFKNIASYFTEKFKGKDQKFHSICMIINYRINAAYNRVRLLEELKNIECFKKAMPLPYEVVLMIVEYLNDHHLEIFIRAFDRNSISV